MNIEQAKQEIFWKAIAVNTSTGYLKRLHRQILEEFDAGGFTTLSSGYSTWSIFYNGGTVPSLVEINPTQFTRDANEYLGIYPFSEYNGSYFVSHQTTVTGTENYRIRNEYEIFMYTQTSFDTIIDDRGFPQTITIYTPKTRRTYLYPNPNAIRNLSTPDFLKYFVNFMTMYYSTGWQEQSFWSQVQTGLAQGLATGLSLYLGASTGGSASYVAQAIALGINYASYKKTQEQQAEYDAYMNKIEDIRTERSKKEEEDSKKVKFDNSFQKDYNYDIRYEDYSDRGLYENYTLTYEKY